MINSRLFVFSCLLALVVSISAIDAWCAPEPTQQVNVNAPQGLLNRSNAKAKQSNESAKKAEPRETEKKVENKSESKNSTASNKESSTTKKDV
ncbi:MAG: hypothetical protein IK092_06280, partial [Muribaculaceae bacterium]|nr:hypothetical protein [Muribaculaceae bacterium]